MEWFGFWLMLGLYFLGSGIEDGLTAIAEAVESPDYSDDLTNLEDRIAAIEAKGV